MTDLIQRTPTDDLIARLRSTRLPPPAERRTLRRASGARLADVARAMGVSGAAVSCWERGIYEPGPRHAVRYLRLLQGFAELAAESTRLASTNL